MYYYGKSERCTSLLLSRTDMTTSEKNRKCDQQEVNNDTLHAGEGNPRGVEKPGGFFSLGGAPIPGLAAEKPGGFFSGPPSGEEEAGAAKERNRGEGNDGRGKQDGIMQVADERKC